MVVDVKSAKIQIYPFIAAIIAQHIIGITVGILAPVIEIQTVHTVQIHSQICNTGWLHQIYPAEHYAGYHLVARRYPRFRHTQVFRGVHFIHTCFLKFLLRGDFTIDRIRLRILFEIVIYSHLYAVI